MSLNSDNDSFVAYWHELLHHARLHGVNLVAVTYADRFRLLQPKEGLSTTVLLSALHRAIHDVVTDLGGRGHAIPVENTSRMEASKATDPVITPRLTPLMNVGFAWALIAFAEEPHSEFWRVFYCGGPVFNLATLAVYAASLFGGAAPDAGPIELRDPLYTRMDMAGQKIIDAAGLLLPPPR